MSLTLGSHTVEGGHDLQVALKPPRVRCVTGTLTHKHKFMQVIFKEK